MDKELLNEVIDQGLIRLSEMDPNDDEYTKVVDNVGKLIDRTTEFEKAQEAKKSEVVRNVINSAGVVLPLAAAFVGTVISLRWENQAPITSKPGKSWLDRLLKIK